MARFVGEDVSEFAPYLTESVTITRPELAQAIVTREGLRHGDVSHVTVLGVDLHQGLDVPVFFQFPSASTNLLATSLDTRPPLVRISFPWKGSSPIGDGCKSTPRGGITNEGALLSR